MLPPAFPTKQADYQSLPDEADGFGRDLYRAELCGRRVLSARDTERRREAEKGAGGQCPQAGFREVALTRTSLRVMLDKLHRRGYTVPI